MRFIFSVSGKKNTSEVELWFEIHILNF